MIRRDITIALALATLYLLVAGGLKYAARMDFIGVEVATRATQVIMGLALAVYANFIPKNLGAFRNSASAQRAQSALRAAGWAFMLGGMGYAIASALPVPDVVSIVILSSATAYVLGYAILAFAPWPRRGDRPV